MVAVPSIGRASLVEAPRIAPEAAATQELYERHAARILHYCRRQLGSREEAEDAVQTTFMNAFRALGRGVVPEAESAWLFKIAENVCLSRRRSSWRRNRIESPSDLEVIEEIVPGPSRQRDELIGIQDALASMPDKQRRAILLREWQGLSYREIAEELDVTQAAVETLVFRARRSLAQGLEQPEGLKPRPRKTLRRALHATDLGALLASLKTFLTGAAAVKATAAAVAVTAAAGAAMTVAPPAAQRQEAPPATTRAASVSAASLLAARPPDLREERGVRARPAGLAKPAPRDRRSNVLVAPPRRSAASLHRRNGPPTSDRTVQPPALSTRRGAPKKVIGRAGAGVTAARGKREQPDRKAMSAPTRSNAPKAEQNQGAVAAAPPSAAGNPSNRKQEDKALPSRSHTRLVAVRLGSVRTGRSGDKTGRAQPDSPR